MDGSILMRDSDDYKDQDNYWDFKKKHNQKLMNEMNAAVKEDLGEDPLEGDNAAQNKSLRNQFNY
jgi:hypothetical protein